MSITNTSHSKDDVKENLQDNINPSHYKKHPSGIEAIDITEHYDFCIGNAIKYLWRAGLKKHPTQKDAEKEAEDLEKAVWYIQRKILKLKETL